MSWVLVFVGFSALIILHEFGHFVVAKWTGMRVERFFLFFPPKVVSVKRGETEYGIGAIPLGGFVKITGMNPEELEPRDQAEEEPREAGFLEKIESADQSAGPDVSKPGEPLPPELRERAYYNQPVWKRIVVIAAGPAVNILIAFLILFGLGFSREEATTLEVGAIESGTPAESALREGDTLISIDGVRPTMGGSRPSQVDLDERADALAAQVNTHTCSGPPTEGCSATTPAALVVQRNGQKQTIQLTPFYDPDAPPINEGDEPGRYRLGFGFGAGGEVPIDTSVPESADWAVSTMWFVTRETVSTIGQIFIPEKREQLSGPVGGGRALNEAIDFSPRLAWSILALISLSLGIINLFPFLPLDGGHIFWSLVEKARGRRVPFYVIERASAVGFLLILLLFVVGLSNDLGRLGDSALEQP